MKTEEIIVQALLDKIPEDSQFSSMVDWENIDEETSFKMKEHLFKLKYGYFPSIYKYKVKQVLEQQNA